jgi:hypothetical protein
MIFLVSLRHTTCDVFDRECINVTKQNKSDLDRVIHTRVGVGYED